MQMLTHTEMRLAVENPLHNRHVHNMISPFSLLSYTPLLSCHVYLRLENSRDDMRVRGEILEREVTELQHRNEELTSLAQEAQALKDEMDILR